MCTVLLPPGVNPIAVNKIYYITSYHIKPILVQRPNTSPPPHLPLCETRRFMNMSYIFTNKVHNIGITVFYIYIYMCRSQWSCALRRRSSAARLLRSWVRIPPRAWMFVCCECCVLLGRGLCDVLITRPEESYRLWRIFVCDEETSKTRRLKPATGLWKIQPQWVVTPGEQTNKQTNIYITEMLQVSASKTILSDSFSILSF
jgi:hypothetical protein